MEREDIGGKGNKRRGGDFVQHGTFPMLFAKKSQRSRMCLPSYIIPVDAANLFIETLSPEGNIEIHFDLGVL